MSLFGKDASFSHLDLGILCHSSLQILSSSVRLDGKRWWTAIFRSLQRCSIGFKSGLWLGHSRTVTELLWSHSFVILAVCLGSLSCWKVNLRPSLRSWALWRRFSSRISLYLTAFIFPSIATSRPVPAAEKQPHSMMLPPPCFTVGTVLDRWWAVPGFLHTYRLESRPKSSILVSSDQRILFVTILESFRCFLANSVRVFMCLALRRGFVGPLCHKAPTGGGLQWWLTFYNFLPSPECISGAQPQWSLGSSPPIAQFGRTASSRKGSGRPKRLPFKNYGGHCALRNLKCSRNCFVTLARSVPCHNSVSELFRQFLWPHDSHLLWHALWAVRSYIDRCVAFLIKSNQYNQTQLDSNEGVEPSQGWSEEMDSTWVKYMSVTAKGLNT